MEEDEDNVGWEPINPFVKRGARIEHPLVPNNTSRWGNGFQKIDMPGFEEELEDPFQSSVD